MKSYFFFPFIFIFFLLSACGGGGSGSTSAGNTNNGPVLTASPTSLTFSGKQFADPPPEQVITLSYSRDVVSIIEYSASFYPGSGSEDIFRVSSDSAQETISAYILNTDVQGGTYMDELVLIPHLQDGGTGQRVTISLTLVQEPTVPIILEPSSISMEVTEGGPLVRQTITVNAGNTVHWKVSPFSYVADGDVFAVTSDPEEGTGSQEVDIVVIPTATLIEDIKQQTDGLPAEISFDDQDAPGNSAVFSLNLSLATTQ